MCSLGASSTTRFAGFGFNQPNDLSAPLEVDLCDRVVSPIRAGNHLAVGPDLKMVSASGIKVTRSIEFAGPVEPSPLQNSAADLDRSPTDDDAAGMEVVFEPPVRFQDDQIQDRWIASIRVRWAEPRPRENDSIRADSPPNHIPNVVHEARPHEGAGQVAPLKPQLVGHQFATFRTREVDREMSI
ncbi:MAG: hypothetical protein QOI20_3421 [Acidimicrobiaceae bacterium]|nr:hypothetical protein [Acidimicrobiaceae bacterium]